jgi:uncharacterized protein YyaL (SSP411 family)
MLSQDEDDQIPLLKGKKTVKNQFYICKNNTCSAPMPTVDLILANI